MIEINDTSHAYLLAPGEIDVEDLVGAADRLAVSVAFFASPVADIDAKLAGETMTLTIAFANGIDQITFKGPCDDVTLLLHCAIDLKNARKAESYMEELISLRRQWSSDLRSFCEHHAEFLESRID